MDFHSSEEEESLTVNFMLEIPRIFCAMIPSSNICNPYVDYLFFAYAKMQFNNLLGNGDERTGADVDSQFDRSFRQ